jgi:hypothetical protein
VRRIASRLWRADAVPVACKVDTRRLIDGLLAGVSTRASRGDRP